MASLASNAPVALTASDIISAKQRLRTHLTICDAAKSDGGRTLLGFYDTHRAKGTLPRRADMPSRALSGILPSLFMLEPTDYQGTDWRFRLAGQEIVTRVGIDPTGLCISQAYELEDAERNAADYRDIAINGNPRVTRGHLAGINREYLDMEIAHVPMIGANGTTPWVLGGVFLDKNAH